MLAVNQGWNHSGTERLQKVKTITSIHKEICDSLKGWEL